MTPAAPAGFHHPTSDEAAAPVAAAGSHHPTSDDDAAPVAIAGDDLLPYYCNHNEDPQKVDRHNQSWSALSEEQQRPLFNVSNTVMLCGLDTTP